MRTFTSREVALEDARATLGGQEAAAQRTMETVEQNDRGWG